jgi:S-DNA-T family DNA segregation ATPase FtsK/SpoIIIE
MSAKARKGEKSLLNRQEITSRRKALNQKKSQSSHTGRRAIAGVVILALSVLSLLAVATFDAKDRVGPGFHNAVGPVGHAIAEALRGLLGVCAFVLPLVGFYVAGLLFIGDKERKRWPQVVSLGLLLVSTSILAQLVFKEDASWAHAPGGVIGRQLGGLLTALFSTVGTVVLVSATACVAFIVGTQFAFLRFCSWVYEKSLVLAEKAKAWLAVFVEQQKLNAEHRKLEAEKAKVEEAEFLAQLEAEEAELTELEAAANDAEDAANEVARLERDREHAKLADLTERERLKAEREKLMVEREAARLAREALKVARANQKDTRKETAAALAPGLLEELTTPPPAPVQSQPPGPMMAGEPAWASALAFGPASTSVNQSSPPLPPEFVQSAPPPARRQPTIHEPPQLPEALATTAAVQRSQADAASAVSSPAFTAMESSTAIAAAGPAALATVGPSALTRMPLIIEPKAPPKPTKKEEFQFNGDRTSFNVPPIDVLEAPKRESKTIDKDAYLLTAERLTAKLKDFGIDGEVVEIRPGPVVTMYEFKPAAGVKISRIASLSDDLAMAMEAMRVRIVAPIPGKGVVGIEVPNKEREMVFLKEIAEQDAFQKSQTRLTMCLGKDIEGMPYILDLAKAPHLLMAGTTGSGKSVAVNAMIMSILLKSTPEEVRFIMVDPKMLELSVYEGIPHLLLPVVTDPRKAAVALQWAVDEMTRRYKLLSEAGVRNITGYNAMVDSKRASNKTVEAKPTVIKTTPKAEPVIPSKMIDAPVALEAAPAELPAPEASEKPKKKRRMLIVDVAETPPSGTPAVSDEVHASAPAPEFAIGVAAPTDLLEDPREGLSPETAAEVQAAATEAEIRVETAESELEAAALAAAASRAESDVAGPAAPEELKKLPFIVVIIDELADLMMVASKEVETSIARLAQMARAAGIHLMVATQRPSTDVVTGIIKANFPTRISFMLRSKPDSMTILGTVGAEALLGMGDMLIMPPTSAHMQRVHGCYVSEAEIKKVVDHLKAQGKPVFDESILKAREEEGGEGEEDDLSDELYDQAIAIVGEMRQVSISMLQRKMRIGYNRSARMIERMEREGIVGAADGAKPRDVLIRPVGQMPGTATM